VGGLARKTELDAVAPGEQHENDDLRVDAQRTGRG